MSSPPLSSDKLLSNVLKQINTMIDQSGFVGIKVPGNGAGKPSFVYTVGLTETYGHPELIIYGFDCNQAEDFLNIAVDMLEENSDIFNADRVSGLADDVVVGCKSVTSDNLSEYLKIANIRYFGIFQAKQIIFPDLSGRLPWDPEWVCDFPLQKHLWE